MSEQEKVSVVGDPALNDAIISDLEESENKVDTDIPVSETPAPAIDISNLSQEQLQALKAALSATPDRANTADQAKVVKVRRINDKYVVDFKRAYLTYMLDETEQRKVETHIIPVKLEGAEDFVDMRYKVFMQADRVNCKVKDMQQREVPIVEGETTDEHGRLVEMVRKEVVYSLVVTTPEGRELNIDGKVANA